MNMFSQRCNHALILSFFSSLLLALLAAGSFSMGAAPANAAQGKQKLEKHYKEWMEHDVVYIITKDEREAFLKLTSNEGRDKFIQDFWEVRNPTSGSPSNSYKDEIYQRIAFADSRFGIGSGTDGWRTDRGHIYITLGAPQQKQVYRTSANLRGIEVWFYANVHPSLPSAFYVMFYEKNGTGDYRFYSPYFDGPDKLTTGVEAQNSRMTGLHMILESVGGELERESLSLIPGEPVDLQTGQSSLESDTMLSILKSLADQPANRDAINKRWMMREQVTSSIIMEGRNLEIITLPVRDARGLTRVDYAVRLRNPSDLSLSTASDGRYTYSVEVQVRVFGEQNKLVFVQQKPVTETFDKRRYAEIKDKAFSYEGMLPLPPGKYRLVFQFTDWSKGASYRTEREVTIPAVETNRFVVPGVLPFLAAEPVDPAAAEVTPFTLAGVKFTPLPTSGLTLSPDVNLQVAYQIWGQPKDPRSLAGQKLHLEYALGMPSAPGSGKIIQDEADMAQFDADGTLVNGKKLELLDKQPGNYILTVAVNSPDSTMRGFAKLNFKVSDAASTNAPWDVVEPSIRNDADTGVFDQQRGLCYLNQGLVDEGRGWLRRALNTNHANEPARTHLVEAYYAKKDYAAVVSLYTETGLSDTADSETYLRIANSLQKTGNLPGAISLLEAGLQAHPQDVALYLGLADFYKQTGNTQKAEELIRKGKSYAPAS
jgi:GWxTD domain-containing protein